MGKIRDLFQNKRDTEGVFHAKICTRKDRNSMDLTEAEDTQKRWQEHTDCCCCWVASVVSDSVWPHRRQPTRLPCLRDSPGRNTGVGCHFLLQEYTEYTEELYKKDLHDPDNHDGVITHLEPDILECEVKWALGSITTNKANGGDGIPVERFQILKDDAVKSAALNMPANLENSAVATGLEKVTFHSNPKERQCQRMFKLLHICTHLTC